jgi:putative hydrolase of the HAD superfamily
MSEWKGTSERVDAVLFDLGNTLVKYYRPADFLPILERSVAAAAAELTVAKSGDGGTVLDTARLFAHAKTLNRERADGRVWPLAERLAEIFADCAQDLSPDRVARMSERFLAPIFAIAKLDPDALGVLSRLRELKLKTAIVSNTPWGSPAAAWREELQRHGLLARVDMAAFCVDVGWRKPAPQLFEHALAQLGVQAEHAWFVGDDLRWDIEGARRAGLTPILLGAAPGAGCHTITRLRDLLTLLEADFTGKP